MTKERPPSLQDKFLQQLRAQEMPLTIFLTNGVKLQGLIASFDGFTVLLVRDGFSATRLQARDIDAHAEQPPQAL